MKRQLAFVLAAFTAACASAPQPEATAPARDVTPAAVDPIGTFDFTTAVEGTVVNGTLTVTRGTDGGYAGSIATNVTETIPVRTVTVNGQTMNVLADTPDGPLIFVMEFRGPEFSGTWTLGEMSGTHSGKRRTP